MRSKEQIRPFAICSEAASVDILLPLLLPWLLSQVISTQLEWDGAPFTSHRSACSQQIMEWDMTVLWSYVVFVIDLDIFSPPPLFFLTLQEPSNKRVKPLSRVTSLANLIPPVKATPLKRFGQTLQVRTQGWGGALMFPANLLCKRGHFRFTQNLPWFQIDLNEGLFQ